MLPVERNLMLKPSQLLKNENKYDMIYLLIENIMKLAIASIESNSICLHYNRDFQIDLYKPSSQIEQDRKSYR